VNARHARVETRDGVLVFTLARADKLNALSEHTLELLRAAVDRLAADADLRVLLIRAEGRFFSAGMDIGEMPDFRGMPPSVFRYRYRWRHQMLWDELETVEKPIVAAHQGPCLGGALEMSLSCDFRLASDAAAYGLPEIRLGVVPGSGGISRLTRIVGPAWARWLVLAGEQVDAQRALAIGLVHAVFPAAELDGAALAFCERLAALPPEAVAAAKLAIDAIDPVDRGSGRVIERLATSTLVAEDAYWERLEAFRRRERRPRREEGGGAGE
jgi:enoyl-CoA hydratase